jgi:hypothetical protein
VSHNQNVKCGAEPSENDDSVFVAVHPHPVAKGAHMLGHTPVLLRGIKNQKNVKITLSDVL